MSGWQQVAVAVLVLLGGSGGLVSLYRVFTDRPKVKADAASIVTASATQQMVNLQTRLEKVEAKYDTVIEKLDLTRDQLAETDRKAGIAERHTERLAWYQQLAAQWHERHRPYDETMGMLARQIKPEMLEDPSVLDRIPLLEPFPRLDDPKA